MGATTPQNTIQQQLEDAKTELNEQKDALATQQATASGLEQDFAVFEQLANDVKTALDGYGHAFKELHNKWKGFQKFHAHQFESISISHRKEFTDAVAGFEEPI